LGADDQATTLVPPPGTYSAPSASPDGHWLAYGVNNAQRPAGHSTQRGVWIRPVDGTQGHRIIVPGDDPSMQVKNVHWSTNSRDVLFSVQATTMVTLYVADTGTRHVVASFHGWWPAWNQALSPNLRWLATAGSAAVAQPYNLPIEVRDVASGATRQVGTGARPVWAPGGARLAYLAGPDALHLVVMVADAPTGQHRQLTTVPQRIEGLAWSPNGQALAYVVHEGDMGPDAASHVWVVGVAGSTSPIAGLRARWIGDLAWLPRSSRP
jgi:dipeptidyl aminopeptidase/acylaminoacyl peptidase